MYAMRIVSGQFKGKKLIAPKHDIRPTLDKVKQALFTKLQFEIEDAVVLDLFCGSGALGIEAISRNAKKVVFCDNNYESISLTKNNILSLNMKNNNTKIEIINKDYKTALNSFNEKFDLIILDPPYESDFYVKALQIIKEKDLLAPNGVIVCERLRSKKIEQNLFTLDCTKEYGSVALDYLIL